MSRRVSFFVGVAAFLLVGVTPSESLAGQAPILFIHEYCSTAASWNDMFQNLPRGRFGDDLIRLPIAADGPVQAAAQSGSRAPVSFALDFSSSVDDSIRERANRLKQAIDYVRARTGEARVILVGHGMGGLVGRAYIEGLAVTANGAPVAYGSDVAGLVTIGTPHLGADLTDPPSDWDAACAARDSLSRREVGSASSGSLLDALNQSGWPSGTRLDVVTSYFTGPARVETDGVVTRYSQDPRVISDYWATHPDVRVWSLPLQGRTLPQWPNLVAHSAVVRLDTAAALVRGLVEELDVDAATTAPATAAPAETAGLPESPHPYENNLDRTWTYTLAGNPGAIDVTFDPQTFSEYNYDFIHVADGNGQPVSGSPFSGNTLGGRTIRLQGATVRIRLTSDESITDYGFRLASVNAATGGAPSSPIPESPHPYSDNYYGIWRYTVAGNPSAIDVTFDSQTSVEEDYDYIFISGADGIEVDGSPFTGTSLAGRTIRVTGATVQIELQSDGSVSEYGFRVTSARAPTGADITVSNVSATTESTSSGVTYRSVLTVRETSGRCSATIASIRVNLSSETRSGGATFDTTNSTITTALSAGGSNTYRLSITSANTTDLYNQVRFVVTYSDGCGGGQRSYSTPTATSVTPPTGTPSPTPSPTPTPTPTPAPTPTPGPPVTSGGTRFDGTYDFSFRHPAPGGTTQTVNLTRFLIIRNSVVTSSDRTVNGTVDNFGAIRFTGPCPINDSGGDWTGSMNQSALAGFNFGEGRYTCRLAIGGGSNNTWRANQSR